MCSCLCLSLTQMILFLVILLDGSVPIKYGLRLNSECKYVDLKQKLATLCQLQPSLMLVCELWNSQIRQVLADEEKLRTQSAKDLYVYQLPESNTRTRSNSALSMHIEQGLKDIQRSSGESMIYSLCASLTNRLFIHQH